MIEGSVLYGELAALATALFWSLTYVLFTIAVRLIGPRILNRLRLTLALVFLLVTHLIVMGEPFPLHMELARWGWLSLSGVIGFAVGDAMLFRAFSSLGAHRSSLIMTLVPVTSALFAWVFLGEALEPLQVVAVLVTVAGIALVVWRPGTSDKPLLLKRYRIGVFYAIGAVVTQSLRYIFCRQGMSGGFPPLSTNVVQIFAATAAIWIWPVLKGQVCSTFAELHHRRACWATIAGALCGPFIGVTLSLVALQLAPVGLTSTLMALSPVFLLPVSHFVLKERIDIRAIGGTVVAMIGATLIFLA